MSALTLVRTVAYMPPLAGELVACTYRYSLSMRGHAPGTAHVWKSLLKVLMCGSPNTQVFGCLPLPAEEAPLIQAGVPRQRFSRGGPGLCRGPDPGAAMLDEQIFDSLDRRVVSEVTTTRSRQPLGAHGVRAQGAAVTGVRRLPADSCCSSSCCPATAATTAAAQVQRCSHKIRVTPQDMTGSCN